MSLYTVTTGNTINAADVNQIVNRLQQPSGGQETISGIFVQMGAYNTGSIIGAWITTSSQGSTPVSVSVTTLSNPGVGAIGPSQLGISGVFVGGGATGVSNTARFQVNITVQY